VSLSQTIAPHLPFLRRYARALTGNQQSGDAYVAAVLEVLIEDPSAVETEDDPRVGLYRTFTKLWNSMAVNGASDSGLKKLPAEQRITQITPRPRQAFLLISLEGFSETDAARILDIDVPTVRTLMEGAGRELATEIATDVLIIEDEPLIAMDIEQMVESLGHRVVGTARTHAEATAMFKSSRAKMILADIQLADGSSGIDAVNEILKTASVPVIFITAFPERLLTGERPEPAFLVTKPFNPDMVKALISQALFFDRQAKAAA
jgi:DNA-directed RNA polymerase specialized sigma24 family protein